MSLACYLQPTIIERVDNIDDTIIFHNNAMYGETCYTLYDLDASINSSY